ncbi:MAG: M28 family peptidase [Bacteroidales bacterium]|nr:M28 family peptidase [Bacteroidales bacterium]
MRKFIWIIALIITTNAWAQNKEALYSNIKASVNFLASDELQGRKPGTEGIEKAVDYIEDQFAKAQLEVKTQAFDVVTGLKLNENNYLKFDNSELKIEKDFIPLGFTKNDNIQAKAQFVGYGFSIKNDSIEWNDYNKNVKSKWVVILTGTPHFYKELFQNKDDLRAKVLTASDQQAAGVIFVNSGKRDELTKLHFDKSKERSAIPVIHITKEAFEKISGKNIDELVASIETQKQPQSFELNPDVSIATDVEYIIKTTYNVIAYSKGKNPVAKNNYIVVGAHYDHLGFGGEDSGSRMPDTIAVHNGADDNASGVAAIIELAKYYSEHPHQQNMMFIAFSAEEMGLLGSKFLSENMYKNNESSLCMFNFDMIGRLTEDGITVGGVGTAGEFEKLIESNQSNQFKISTNPDGFGPSDHASFYMQKSPVLFISTGAHSDYHTPFDDVDKINYTGMVEIVSWAIQLISDVDKSELPLKFKETNTQGSARHGASYKVTFGIIPDFNSKDNNGLKVDGLRKGGPAETAGMLKDDIITMVNGKKVTNIYDYMYRLGELQEGDTATVDVLRNGQHKIILIQL